MYEINTKYWNGTNTNDTISTWSRVRFASQTSSTEAAGAHAEEPASEEAICAAVDEGVQEEAELAANMISLVLHKCTTGIESLPRDQVRAAASGC